MDNYYTSPRPFLTLYHREVGAIGTISTNRKFYPKEIAVAAGSVERTICAALHLLHVC